MRHNVHKGLQDIRTRGSLTSDAENPQRKFLRLASLELKKSLCRKVRDAARKRSEEMDRKIAELDVEQAQLLASSQVSDPGELELDLGFTATERPTRDIGSSERRRLALKY
jgi:hypothetical protein